MAKPTRPATTDAMPLLALLILVPLLCLWASLHLRRQQRLLHDLPTSKADGVFIGLVELKGTAESPAPLCSYLAGQSCIHYAWRVEEHWSRTVIESYTDDKGRPQTRTRHESGWTTVAEGGESQDFYVRDDSGAVLVRPQGAKIDPLPFFNETVGRGHLLYYDKGPPTAVADSDHERRFAETGLPLHVPLFVVGQARERADVVAPEIAASRDAAMFLISTRSEEKVQSAYAGWSWFWWALGLLATGVPLFIGFSDARPSPIGPPILLTAPLAVYLLLWGIGWIWMAFNSLVGLRNRVRQGWSLIDVQLKRRHDLIPNLVTAVSGLTAHEQTVQTALAALRAQAQATPPGAAGPDFDGLVGSLCAVIEKYPQLTAQPSFGALHRSLVETEQRIALARTYYNDIATHFATRLEQVPDRWIARLGGMRPEPLLGAENFERAPVAVNFAR